MYTVNKSKPVCFLQKGLLTTCKILSKIVVHKQSDVFSCKDRSVCFLFFFLCVSTKTTDKLTKFFLFVYLWNNQTQPNQTQSDKPNQTQSDKPNLTQSDKPKNSIKANPKTFILSVFPNCLSKPNQNKLNKTKPSQQ